MKIFKNFFAGCLLSACFLLSVNALDVVVGAFGDKGRRGAMEDSHLIYSDAGSHVFGVFDGHGGAESAFYASQCMGPAIIEGALFNQDRQAAIKNAFLTVDKACCDLYEDGTTAVVAVIDNQNTLWLAHAGDARIVVAGDNGLIAETIDHKPNGENEKNRIELAGGFVSNEDFYGHETEIYRVNRILAVSRALGDRDYKKYGVVGEPDIQTIPVKRGDFMILACDGLWDVMSSEEAVVFVQKQMNIAGVTAQTITSECANLIALRLVTKAINGRIDEEDDEADVSLDNVTVVLAFVK